MWVHRMILFLFAYFAGDLTEEEGERRRNGKRSIDASSRGEKGEDRQGEEPVTVKASSTGDVVTLSIEETK